ncbi:MAG: polyhydroxybutyrate depolymerase [Myxococcota bacterium]|jgi:polyhydroxybutyrate depolymerase
MEHSMRRGGYTLSMLLPRLLCVLLPIFACRPDAIDSTVPPCDGSGLGPGDYERSEIIDGLERTWTVHVPPSTDGTAALPLVLNLHPYVLGGNEVFHEIWRTESGMEPLADLEGFIVVHPEGTGLPAAWNAGEACCGDASADNVDDIGFLLYLIDSVSEETCVDARRIYATGMSNGGYLSHRLACEHPDRVAAIAPVVGSFSSELTCEDGRAMPVLQISGSEDSLESREASVARWAESNECDAVGEPQSSGDATCSTWTGCRDGVDVTHCIVEDGGHCWFSDHEQQMSPGCGPVDFISEQAAWDFFSRWSLP